MAGKGYLRPKGCQIAAIMARKGLGLSAQNLSKEKLVNLRMATSTRSSHVYLIDLFLQKYDMTLKDLQLADIPNNVKIKALQNKAIDLLSSSEPSLSRIIESGEAEVLAWGGDILPDYDMSMVLFGPSLLKDRPDLGVRFMKGYLKGLKAYQEGKTKQNLEIISKHTKLAPSVLKSVCFTAMRPGGTIKPQSIMDFQKWAFGKGRIDKIIPPEQFWEPKFLEQATNQP